MTQQIRELFEKHTVPNFSVGVDMDTSKNIRGEYINPTLEDHWQTFQEAAELIVRECAKVLTQHGAYFSGDGEPYHYAASLIEEHFGVKE